MILNTSNGKVWFAGDIVNNIVGLVLEDSNIEVLVDKTTHLHSIKLQFDSVTEAKNAFEELKPSSYFKS